MIAPRVVVRLVFLQVLYVATTENGYEDAYEDKNPDSNDSTSEVILKHDGFNENSILPAYGH